MWLFGLELLFHDTITNYEWLAVSTLRLYFHTIGEIVIDSCVSRSISILKNTRLPEVLRLDQLCSSDWILFLSRSLKLVSNSPPYWLTNSTFCYLWEFLRNQTSRVSSRDSRSLLNCRISAWKSWRSEKYSSRWHDRQMQMFNSAETGEGGKNCFRVFSNSLNPPGL